MIFRMIFRMMDNVGYILENKKKKNRFANKKSHPADGRGEWYVREVIRWGGVL